MNASSRILWLMVGLLAVACLFWNLDRWPAPWVDEGIHVNAASVLAEDGRWGLRYSGRVHAFDPSIQAGPPIIAAAAFGLRTSGRVTFGSARWPLAVIALAGWLTIVVATTRAFGAPSGVVAGVMLLAGTTEPFTSFVFLGRQVLGEVAALTFLALGFATLSGGSRTQPLVRGAVAGICLGLALLSKGQLLVVVPVALVFVMVADVVHWRAGLWRPLVVALVVGLVIMGSWMLTQRVALGEVSYQQAAMTLGDGFRTQIITGDLENIRRAGGVLWRTGYWWWGVPAVAWALWRLRRSGHDAALGGLALAVLAVMLAWFAGLSIGWARYGFYVVALTVPWTAVLAVTVGRGVFGTAWTGRDRVVGATWLAGVLLAFALPALQTCSEMRAPVDTGFGDMRSHIAASVPAGARIETWEWEFSIDRRLVTTHPGLSVMYAATATVVGGGRVAPADYDALQSDPDYILQGPFGGWTGIYDDVIHRLGPPVARFGRYALYRVADHPTGGDGNDGVAR